MTLQTNLNSSPYYDDYDPNKDFYRVLFQPGVAVQARELNQLQSILQNQIEKFGDNIFKKGTIISGCNILFHSSLPFVKIKDVETDGTPVNITEYKNLYVKNNDNVSGFIVETIDGFETRSPDLNTLFVKYNSSGTNSNTQTFSAGEPLTVYTPEYPIFKYKIIDGSSGFSNNDSVVVVSAIAVQNSTGGSGFPVGAFSVNQIIQNGVANAVIIEANSTANSSALILKIKPLAADLKTANTIKWRFTSGETILNANTANVANVVSTIGTNATGSLVTDSLGKITSIAVTNLGSGYSYTPYVGVSITSGSGIGTSEISQLDATAQNYLTTITVANSALSSIGTGYGMSVDDGVIYQKGFFSRVEKQLLVVNKYSNTGFTKSVGFNTEEEIVDSNKDTSLLDNATGTPNATAPGADRLKLIPTLFVLDKADADANSEFLPIVEFADGKPYRQSQQTVYNLIGDELAKRTYEESGNYVLDQFILTTKDSPTFTDNAAVFKINIDPGKAYIKGYKVETTTNYTANVDKGNDIINSPTSTIKIGYGNYIKVNQLGGVFQFNTGDAVEFYDTAVSYLTTSAGGTAGSAGTKIGQARMRSLILDEGEIGTPNATYRLYLFDIIMEPGKNFSNVRSVFYDGTNKGVADIRLDSGSAALYDTSQQGLVYKPVNAIKSANNITYQYRTMDQSKVANTTGYITVTPAAGEYFPYTESLNDVEKRDILIVPLASYQASANAPGTISTTSASANVTGSGSMNFVNVFKPGDFVKFANSTASSVGQIAQIVNTTFMTLTSSVATTTLTGNAVLYFPRNAPISLTSRTTRTANVEANGQMTIFLANTIANTSGSTTSANVALTYNVVANNVNPAAKTSNRGIYTRVRVANNAGSTTGPWALGVADAYRLRGVYVANGAPVVKTFSSNTAIANDFITIVDNPFANGDSMIYTVPTANTILTGMANNTLYYAVYANSSGFAVATIRNGANVNITASVNEETHSFAGSPLYFAEDTNGVRNVTNDYYVDNNQREDYLDTSYLYLKPRGVSVSVNDVILVKYDAFTTGAGVKTVSSYNINDSANLASLVAGPSINTLEIPEMIGTNDKYYDLRDQVDFRPSSANTIPLITELSNTSIVNPTEPTDANRFNSSEQKFPVPNSNMSANITYYVARNDRVVLDKNGGFVVVKGTPGVIDAFPPQPEDSITLQYLNIPPYPSLPFALSKDTVQILDTKVANEKYGKRQNNFKVTTPIDNNQRARIQTKNYQMSDIATLERRIKDLEYYVSFTLAEVVAKSRFIPSSGDSTVDRYKFGFFVDPFTDYSFSDTDNPEYYATIKNDQLVPKINELNFEFFYDSSLNGDVAIDSDGLITLPFVEYELISQNDATDGSVIDSTGDTVDTGTGTGTTANTTTPTTTAPTSNTITVSTVTQSIATVIERQKNTNRRDSPPYVYDDFFYTFSTLTGPAQLYANHRDNNMAFEISQSPSKNGPWSTTVTSASAVPITTGDIYSKGISGLNDGRKIEHPGELRPKSYGPVGGFKEDQMKILWTHDPARGQYYRVRAYKGKNHGGQGRSGTYGYKMFYPTDTVTTTVVTIQNPTNFNYTGTVYSITPSTFTLSMSFNNILIGTYYPASVYVADSQKFEVSIAGLKPNTFHNFFFAGEDVTAKCKQIRTTTTNTTGLLSDADGIMKFDYYYDAGIDEATTDLEQRYNLLSASAGTKIFSVRNSDGSSFAGGEVTLKYYTTLTPELLNSGGTLNVTSNTSSGTNDYNYSGSLAGIVDNTEALPAKLISRSFTGGTYDNVTLNIY